MDQIIKNYLFIAAVPFLAGTAVRFAFRRARRAYLVTLAFAVLAAIGWAAFSTVFSHGSEGYGILALQAAGAAAGALLAGLLIRRKRDR